MDGSFDVKQMPLRLKNVFKGLMPQFSWLEGFRYGKISGWWMLDEFQYENGLKDQL